MGVCMIMPQSVDLGASGTRLSFMNRGNGGCAIDVEESWDGARWTTRVVFTPGGQVMSIRRLTPEEVSARK